MSVRRGAVAGAAAACAALGAGELVAALVRPAASPVLAVASLLVDLAPPAVKDAVIAAFGTADKAFLLVLLVVVVLAGAVAAGVLEVRRPPAGRVVVALAGAFAAVAAVTRSGAAEAAVVPSAAAALGGILALGALTGTRGVSADRRRFLAAAGIWSMLGLAAVAAGETLSQGARSAGATIRRLRLPVPAQRAAALPAGADLRVAGLPPLITPAAEFYRIDIALSPPAVDPADWALEVSGMVRRPLRLTFRDLLERPLIEARVTLACVSNPIGGDLIGTATWLGLPLRVLLAEAGVDADADMVLSSGADGFTASTPLSVLTDRRNALLAVGMNGAPLPQQHGFPARLVVPGLYGYVSATKWVTRLLVTRFDREEAYWTPRGYAPRAPVKLSSRIDVPSDGASVTAGPVVVAGFAWAQHTGVARVQVSVDGGAWNEAELSSPVTDDIWRQWRWNWTATNGQHDLRVRAVDRRGMVQVARGAPVAPDGATGLHRIRVDVR